ncbi:hypothetical protein SDC9_142302 [bioreactor metagenome]|uniref:Uncharacterized protein n=1 Tax=bioreactor metagenome TaxID=1076179 RepID=A0A645E0T1_9ZZZZ
MISPRPDPQRPEGSTPVSGPCACSASQPASCPAANRSPASSNPDCSATLSSSGKASSSRSRSTRNSRASKSWWTAVRSQPCSSRSVSPRSSVRSLTRRFRCRLRRTSSMCSLKDAPALPGTWSARASRFSSPLKLASHFAAVFTPTPGTPGRLSLVSPTRAASSG